MLIDKGVELVGEVEEMILVVMEFVWWVCGLEEDKFGLICFFVNEVIGVLFFFCIFFVFMECYLGM